MRSCLYGAARLSCGLLRHDRAVACSSPQHRVRGIRSRSTEAAKLGPKATRAFRSSSLVPEGPRRPALPHDRRSALPRVLEEKRFARAKETRRPCAGTLSVRVCSAYLAHFFFFSRNARAVSATTRSREYRFRAVLFASVLSSSVPVVRVVGFVASSSLPTTTKSFADETTAEDNSMLHSASC